VNIDEMRSDPFKKSLCDRLSVNEYSVLTGHRKLASHDELTIVELYPSLIEDRLLRRYCKQAFDRRRIFAFLYKVRRNTFARECAKAIDDDRLARARLAGEQIQSGAELDFERIDQSYVFDLQEGKHLP
jgi:hypothetical protein